MNRRSLVAVLVPSSVSRVMDDNSLRGVGASSGFDAASRKTTSFGGNDAAS